MPRSARLTATLALALSMLLAGAGEAYAHGSKGGSSPQHGKHPTSSHTAAAEHQSGRHAVPLLERARPSSAKKHAAARHAAARPTTHGSATSAPKPAAKSSGAKTAPVRTTSTAKKTTTKPVVHANVTLIGAAPTPTKSGNSGKGHQRSNGALKGNVSKNGKGPVQPASAGTTTPRNVAGGLTLGQPAPFVPAPTKTPAAAKLPSKTSGNGTSPSQQLQPGAPDASTPTPSASASRSSTPGSSGRNSAQEVPYAATAPPERRTSGLLVAVIVLFIAALGAMIMGAGYRGRATR